MRAVLLASATAANFGDLRLRSPASQGDAFAPRSACWGCKPKPQKIPPEGREGENFPYKRVFRES